MVDWRLVVHTLIANARNRIPLRTLIHLKRRLPTQSISAMTALLKRKTTHYLRKVRTARQFERMQVPEMNVPVVPSRNEYPRIMEDGDICEGVRSGGVCRGVTYGILDLLVGSRGLVWIPMRALLRENERADGRGRKRRTEVEEEDVLRVSLAYAGSVAVDLRYWDVPSCPPRMKR